MSENETEKKTDVKPIGEVLSSFKENLQSISVEARRQQAELSKVTEKAEYGLKIIDAAGKIQEVRSNPQFREWAVSGDQMSRDIKWTLYQASSQSHLVHTLLSTNVSSGTTVLFSTMPTRYISKDMTTLMKTSREVYGKELNEFLSGLEKTFARQDLVQRREGAWTTFFSGSEDLMLQASQSMRNLLELIVSQWAPNELVERAPWIQEMLIQEKAKNSEWKPKGRERIQFLLFGDGDIVNLNLLNQLSASWEALNKKFERLKEVSHGSKASAPEVESCMTATEELMLAIFNARKLRKT